jgi:hypothetical protein
MQYAVALPDAEVRDMYNKAVMQEYEKFKAKAAIIHQNKQSIATPLAKEAFETRHHIKLAHREETSYIGGTLIAARNLWKYGSPSGPTYEYLRKQGKTPEEIAYSAFKTDGSDLGLANNGVGEALQIWQVIKSTGNLEIYPEHLSKHDVDWFKSQSKGKLTKESILASYQAYLDKNQKDTGTTPAALPWEIPVTATPITTPIATPTEQPTAIPTAAPTATPTAQPTAIPTATPAAASTAAPTPTAQPTATPTAIPTATPTAASTAAPTPTAQPTATPIAQPTTTPAADLADISKNSPSIIPTGGSCTPLPPPPIIVAVTDPRFEEVTDQLIAHTEQLAMNTRALNMTNSRVEAVNSRVDALNSRVDKLQNDIQKNDKKAMRGIASVAAMGNVVFPSAPGKTVVSAGVGSYDCVHAVAISISHRPQKLGQMSLQAGVATSSGGKPVIRVGAAYEF